MLLCLQLLPESSRKQNTCSIRGPEGHLLEIPRMPARAGVLGLLPHRTWGDRVFQRFRPWLQAMRSRCTGHDAGLTTAVPAPPPPRTRALKPAAAGPLAWGSPWQDVPVLMVPPQRLRTLWWGCYREGSWAGPGPWESTPLRLPPTHPPGTSPGQDFVMRQTGQPGLLSLALLWLHPSQGWGGGSPEENHLPSTCSSPTALVTCHPAAPSLFATK